VSSSGRWNWGAALRRLLRAGPEGTERVLELARDATWSARVVGGGVEVRCSAGLALVTIEGDPEDHVLCAGAAFVSDRRGRLAVWALEPTRVRVTARGAPAGEALGRREARAGVAGEGGAALGIGRSAARR
jgi:hypothetical protein